MYPSIKNNKFSKTLILTLVLTLSMGNAFSQRSISGVVFHDQNGLTDKVVNGTRMNLSTLSPLYANLLINGTMVHATTPVVSNGSYLFSNLNPGTYIVQLSTIAGTINNTAPRAALPLNWVYTGENIGLGAGNDGVANGLITVIVGLSNITEVNFGVESISSAYSKTYSGIDPNAFNTTSGNNNYPFLMKLSNLSGSADGEVNANGHVLPGFVSGSDQEDGKYSGVSGSNAERTLVLAALPDSNNDVMVYNGLVLKNFPRVSEPSFGLWNTLTARYEITNFDASKLEIYIRKNGHTTTSFKYAWFDAAGIMGNVATYLVSTYAALPITLVQERASWEGSAVSVTWTTANERNAEKFEIERSFDGEVFQTIGELAATGNSNSMIQYSFNDEYVSNISASYIYYRLRMIDTDGSTATGKMLFVTKEKATSVQFSVYPNPAVDQIQISSTQLKESAADIKIYNMAGSVVKQMSVNSFSQSHTIETHDLPSGIYYINVITAGEQTIVPFVKQGN